MPKHEENQITSEVHETYHYGIKISFFHQYQTIEQRKSSRMLIVKTIFHHDHREKQIKMLRTSMRVAKNHIARGSQ